MASKKTNLRSFRYSDEVAAILEQQEGKSLNDKFENLVLTCYYKLPEIQKSIDCLTDQRRAEYFKLWDSRNKLEEFKRLFSSLETAQHYLDIVVRKAESIAGVTQSDAAVSSQLEG